MKYKARDVKCEAIYCDGTNGDEIHKHFPGCFVINGCYSVKYEDGVTGTLQQSLFERLFEPVKEKPEKKKTELPKGRPLPDWVEVGAYAYFDEKYHKITSISTSGQTPVVYFDTGEHLPWGGVRFDKVEQARIVPWTGDLSFCVGKVFKYKGVTMLCLASRDDCLAFVGGNEYKASELLKKGFTFADGSPCGKFEHLEYDPIDECFDWVD